MKIVKRLLTETPSRKNYKLCITGHGSGGALATLFGLHVAAGGGSADPDDDDALMDEDAMLQAAIAASMEVREWMESHTSIVEAIARSIPALARARERWKKSTFLSFSPSFPPLSLPTHKQKHRRPLPSSKQPEEEDPRRCTQPAEERNRPRRPRSRSPRRRQEREREETETGIRSKTTTRMEKTTLPASQPRSCLQSHCRSGSRSS